MIERDLLPHPETGKHCARCGSTQVREQLFGLYDSDEPLGRDESDLGWRFGGCVVGEDSWAELCLTCGNRRDERRRVSPGLGASILRGGVPDRRAARVIRSYARWARQVLAAEEDAIVSYAGMWLMLAYCTLDGIPAVTDALGVSKGEAQHIVVSLLSDPHPSVGAAVETWLRDDAALLLLDDVVGRRLEGQAELDAWAAGHTRGLISEFPLRINSDSLVVLASALAATTRWRSPMGMDREGRLVMADGFQAVALTTVGPVGVAKPFAVDGLDVYSMVAEPGVSPSAVWNAVDEVLDLIEGGRLWPGDFPPSLDGAEEDLTSGAFWVRELVTEMAFIDDAVRSDVWRSHLPKWTAAEVRDIMPAPGVGETAAWLVNRLRPLSDGGRVEARQSAVANYSSTGFEAAAVSALGVDAAGVPQFEERTVRRTDLYFDHPHAVIAVARGGAWEGVPLFHGWVAPERS